ncbi:MAG: restriction endonuclease subunit S [Candidatus Enterosoma sp.]|nr:restriction endonuclease subunit S [Candidatus Enterosoma sp.]
MKMIKLGELADIRISNVDKKSKPGETPVCLCNFTDVYNNWAITSSHLHDLMKATANDQQIEKFSLQKGDVVITKDSETRDDIGMSAYIADDFSNVVLGYHCALIRPKKDLLNGKYLNAFLNSSTARKYFSNFASGSGQRYTLIDSSIKDIMIPVIPLEEQEKIGNVFSHIDAKIENNNIIIHSLEEMAHTIYDYWFLQFEFPNSDGKPYKSSGGKMVWNEELERNIPEGWKSGRISDLGNIVGGGTPSTTHSEYYTKQGIAWMTPKDFAGSNNIFVSHGGRDITEDGLRNSSATLMPQGTVLMSSRAPIGYLGIASNELCTNQGFKSIVPTKSYCSEFIFFTLQTIMPYIKQFGTGSTFSEVSAGEFASVKVLLPHTKISNAFGEKISSIFAMIKNLEEENQRLSSLRDFLLPLLMNGQVLIG